MVYRGYIKNFIVPDQMKKTLDLKNFKKILYTFLSSSNFFENHDNLKQFCMTLRVVQVE